MNKKVDLKLEDRDTLHLKVCNVLRKAILQGDFAPGERLIQEDLAKALGVSRMPVREALRRLETEGLIKLMPHRGAIVKSLNAEDVDEIYSLRAELEKLAASKSVDKMKEEDIAELEQLVEDMNAMDDLEQFVEANIEFHRLLMKYCEWERLLSFIETLWNGFPQQTPHMLTGQVDLSKQEHEEILWAVKERDAAKASKLLANHISRTGKSLMESIRQSKSGKENLIDRILEQ
ncbi:MAG TPA: GntR family transcriptional regulator [Bacillales bacterium]|nr:GntR family transcriptional regulator [Bacillales bacterium]